MWVGVVDVSVFASQPSWLKKWKLNGMVKSIKKNKNCPQLIAAYKVGAGGVMEASGDGWAGPNWSMVNIFALSLSLSLFSTLPLSPTISLQDFCSSESHSIAGEIKVVTEPDHLSPVREILQLLSVLHRYVVQGRAPQIAVSSCTVTCLGQTLLNFCVIVHASLSLCLVKEVSSSHYLLCRWSW